MRAKIGTKPGLDRTAALRELRDLSTMRSRGSPETPPKSTESPIGAPAVSDTQPRPLVGICVVVVKEGKILFGKRKGSHGAGEYATLAATWSTSRASANAPPAR